jgi:hypothetical protein
MCSILVNRQLGRDSHRCLTVAAGRPRRTARPVSAGRGRTRPGARVGHVQRRVSESGAGAGKATGRALASSSCSLRVCRYGSSQSWARSVTRAFLLKKDRGSPRLPSRALVLSHSLARRTFTAEE